MRSMSVWGTAWLAIETDPSMIPANQPAMARSLPGAHLLTNRAARPPRFPAPHEEACESQQHERARARLRRLRLRNRRYRCCQIVADNVHAERVAKKSKVAPLKAMCRALCSERIDIRQNVAIVK